MPESTWGSNHIRWMLSDFTLRLTTDVPVRFVREQTPFVLTHPAASRAGSRRVARAWRRGFVREAQERTEGYWREWVRYLSIPLEWQDAVIRSAITLKLCQYEDTGAIIAAMTTSIPEAPDTSRNWDYRYCWLRDAAFVVRALNRLGATRSMEEYLRYIFNIATTDGSLQPLYGINFEEELHEYEMAALAGYRGMGPVRRGNLAWVQTTARRVRQRGAGLDPAVLRPAPGQSRQRADLRAAWSAWANVPTPCTTCPTRACGNSVGVPKCIPIPA